MNALANTIVCKYRYNKYWAIGRVCETGGIMIASLSSFFGWEFFCIRILPCLIGKQHKIINILWAIDY
jgi:hypothetical protein